MNAPDAKKVCINKRLKGQTRAELENLNKAELIDKIIQLEAHNYQLKNILHKKLNADDKKDEQFVALMQEIKNTTAGNRITVGQNDADNIDKQAKRRQFDWSRAHKRHVLLKLLYFGWDYHGYACQEDSNETIEHHLFRALERTCLIESRVTSKYHRCGRTDKEVSAFCQVISIDLRSKYPKKQQHEPQALAEEIDYCGLLNRVLPKNIQCIAWMPLKSDLYSARFDCIARTYRYYFPKANLNIEAIREACKLLVRYADFRNFCKMDVHNGVINYMRNLQAAHVEMCPAACCAGCEGNNDSYVMYYLEIKANAFLWHQIRCIMAVLLLIGQGKEQPSVISELLDILTNPCKPQYKPAIGLPLNLFHCDFRKHTMHKYLGDEATKDVTEMDDEPNVNSIDTAETDEPDTSTWIYKVDNLQLLIQNVQSEWTKFSVKSTMIRNVLYELELLLAQQFDTEPVAAQVFLLQESLKPRQQYQPLLQRKRCESLENRIEHFVKKQRLVVHECSK